jgi:predicted component of type VI protein secretion system
MLQADLKVLGGKFQGKLIPLNTKKFLVGREQDCHLRPNSDMVSRHHCIFLVDDFTVRLRDLGSTNGTRVNGEMVRHEVVLNDGDKITIGKLELQLAIRAAVPAEAVAAGSSPAPAATELPSSEFELPVAPSASETSYDMPAAAAVDMGATVASFAGDTAIHNSAQMPGAPGQAFPAMPPGYGYPAGVMPGYPPGYPVAYPGYPPGYLPPGMPMGVPGYLPAMPGYPAAPPPAQPASNTAATVEALPVRLPPPEETGARATVAPPAPVVAAPTAEGAPPPSPKEVEKSSNSAADIIKQYMQRRGTK